MSVQRIESRMMGGNHGFCVESGRVTDFPTFALRCAREFTPTIHQGSELDHEPPRLREETARCERNLAESEIHLAKLEAMSAAEAEKQSSAAHDEACRRHEEDRREREERSFRLAVMMKAVNEWDPPTLDHVPLKGFMIGQLAKEMPSDFTFEPPQRQGGEQWLRDRKKSYSSLVAHERKALIRQRKTLDPEANQWITLLYKSLGVPIPPRAGQ